MAENNATRDLLKKVSDRYGLKNLKDVIGNDESLLFKKDVYICLHNILKAVLSGGDVLAGLREAKNVYGAPVFAVNAQKGTYRIKSAPDFDKAIGDLKNFSNCFKLSPYSIINTFLAVAEAQITGFDLSKLYKTGTGHIEGMIEDALKNNPNWDKNNLTSKNPVLIVPIGAAGTGKSTFYRELSNVINISCDNIRYLLFKEFGPCFSSWESCLSWWTVNQLTDYYLDKGYSVFYNGVNTDMEYRSPVTMENPDSLYAGIPYNIKIVYFEPPVKLNPAELGELKAVNLWSVPIDKIDTGSLPPNVAKIMELIGNNFQRTMARTKEIGEGKKKQDPFDVLYSVPAPIVKLFVEQSFEQPSGKNIIIVPRREIPGESKRAEFYREYARKVLGNADKK